MIYAPAGNAGEYSELAANPYTGCGHECLYCYVPLAMHIKRDSFNAGAFKRRDFLRRLQDDAEHFQRAGVTAQIFLTFSSDPYHLDDTQPRIRLHGLRRPRHPLLGNSYQRNDIRMARREVGR